MEADADTLTVFEADGGTEWLVDTDWVTVRVADAVGVVVCVTLEDLVDTRVVDGVTVGVCVAEEVLEPDREYVDVFVPDTDFAGECDADKDLEKL